MIHLSKTRCGYTVYTCTGIKKLTPFVSPNCDPVNYDRTSDSRSQDNNFLNLPTKFTGVVSTVQFIDLSGVQIRDPRACIHQYDPLHGELIDAFDIVASDSNYIAARGNQKQHLDCYSSDSIGQGPGILLPSASLGTFSPVPMLAVPTVALASMVPATPSSGRSAIRSGCQGFCATAKAIGSYRVEFKVSAGEVIVGAASDGTPITIPVAALSDSAQGQDKVKKIQVYAIAGYDMQQHQWNAVLDWKAPGRSFKNTTPTKWTKQKQIATVTYVDRSTVDVIQSQCSPIDLRDWVSEAQLPSTTDQTLYVFSFQGSSAKKGWIPVKDC